FVAREDFTGRVGFAGADALDGSTKKRALFEREGVAFAQVVNGLARLRQVQLGLDGFGPLDVDGARLGPVAELVAHVLDYWLRLDRRMRHILERFGKRFRQVEHELAEQHVAPKLVGY